MFVIQIALLKFKMQIQPHSLLHEIGIYEISSKQASKIQKDFRVFYSHEEDAIHNGFEFIKSMSYSKSKRMVEEGGWIKHIPTGKDL